MGVHGRRNACHVFGKRAFPRAHQTWSHALPVIGFLALLLYLLTGIPASVAMALAAGMALHALLDWTDPCSATSSACG